MATSPYHNPTTYTCCESQWNIYIYIYIVLDCITSHSHNNNIYKSHKSVAIGLALQLVLSPY